MLDAIAFDMDGTLVDTLQMTARAFFELSGSFGLPDLPDERIRAAIGLSDPYFYQALFPDANERVLGAFARAVEARENECARFLGPAVLFPGVREMLEALRGAGRRLFIASCGSESHVTAALREGGVIGLFDQIACGGPDKTGMLKSLTAGLDPARCALVGDTQIDALAARSAGIAAFGAGFGYLRPKDYPLFDRVFTAPDALSEALIGVTRETRKEV